MAEGKLSHWVGTGVQRHLHSNLGKGWPDTEQLRSEMGAVPVAQWAGAQMLVLAETFRSTTLDPSAIFLT